MKWRKAMEKTKIVFDVDDTICSNVRRLGYENCVPDFEVIKKINHLHDDLGFSIVLHTARGMVSCNGDIDKIIAKNKKVLEDWLEKYDVHYDELIFCKPIADLYVDDKALNVAEFKTEDFSVLHGGGSNKPIYRLGKMVKKFLGSESDASNFKDWVEDNNGSCKFPRVVSYLYDAVYMDFVDGENLVDCFTFNDLMNLVSTILRFSRMKKESFDIVPQIEILEKNYSGDEEMNVMIDVCKNFIIRNEHILNENASYSHGDMILSNVIKAKDGDLFFIDSRYFRESSSYLLDFAKLRNSLSGYELEFGLSKSNNKVFLDDLDMILKFRGIYEIVVGLHLMYVLRLYRYKDDVGKMKVKNIAKGIIEDNEELFEWHKEG